MRALYTRVVRDRLVEHIWVPDRMGTPAKILLIPLSALWSGMKDPSSSVSISRRLSTRVFVDMCIYIYLYVYADEVREWKVNERIIARMANFLDTDKEMFPVTKERIERITQ